MNHNLYLIRKNKYQNKSPYTYTFSVLKLLGFFLVVCMFFILSSCQSPESEYEKAKQEDTIEAYQNFIKKYPSDTLSVEAKKQLARLEYKNFANNPSLGDLLKLMEKYSDSNYKDSAYWKFLEARDYAGITMNATLINKKDLCSFSSKDFRNQVTIVFKGNTTLQMKGCSDLNKEFKLPAVVKLTFNSSAGNMKEISLKDGLGNVYILRKPNTRIMPKRMGVNFPGVFGKSSFSFALFKKGEIVYQISNDDYFDLALLFNDAQKGDLIIFDSTFVAKIM